MGSTGRQIGWSLRECEVLYRSKSAVRDLPNRSLNSSSDVVALVHGTRSFRTFVAAAEERFIALALDASNAPIGWHLVGKGGGLVCPVDISSCFRALIVQNAIAAIVLHNHPSGDVTPSPDDVQLTDRLVRAGRVLNIPVLDHVIVAEDRLAFYSFRDANMLSVDPT